MSVLKKLMEARITLQGESLKKSGHNKFAGYDYFELGDFLPTIQKIFKTLGLCGVVSYDEEMAKLTITDTDDGTAVEITSPMGSAALKGCHEVQNIGAVETYQRRYLWVTAMEIVEHDAIDATTGADKSKVIPTKTGWTPNDEELEFLNGAFSKVRDCLDNNRIGDVKAIFEKLDEEEKLFIWNKLSPNERKSIKSHGGQQ